MINFKYENTGTFYINFDFYYTQIIPNITFLLDMIEKHWGEKRFRSQTAPWL